MRKYIGLCLLWMGILLVACEPSADALVIGNQSEKALSEAEQIVNQTIDAHGGERYETANYQFVFRDKKFRFKNDGADFEYQVEYEKNDTLFEDFLNNSDFKRKADGEWIELSKKQEFTGVEAINSVIYFATLPHKLNDVAVNKSYEGEIKIKGVDYDVIKVTFDEEGGGVDHEDNFYYWINKESKLIDYLAYNYQVNGGGVRFREAFNTRRVDGIVFQDYHNYKAEIGTDLKDLPKLFEEGALKKLSEIKTEDVVSLSGNG